MIIEQTVIYKVGDKSYLSYEEAEAAVVDMLGEEIDDIFKGIDTGELRYTKHAQMLIDLVEELWKRREKIKNFLDLHYEKSQYIQMRIEEEKYQ